MAASQAEDSYEENIAEDSLPPAPSADAVPLRLSTLFPWHRPRKQKVRQDQWVGLTAGLIDKLKAQHSLSSSQIVLADGSTVPEIRYLTLPGLDYLDVRLIAETCSGKGCRLTSVGFLEDAAEAPALARARVRETGLIQAGYISDTSTTFARSLESICRADGASLSELKRRAPFHVVNIDACGSIAPTKATHSSRLVDAVYRLIELQLSKANHRWLLFLTVDVRSKDMNEATFDSLCGAIRENALKSDEFRGAAMNLFNPKACDLDAAMVGAKKKDGRSLLDLFTLGFSKWLLHLAEQKQWSVKLKRSHFYSTRPMEVQDPSMCSLAFEFVPPPIGLPDPFNVTRQKPSPGNQLPDASMQILQSTIEISDLDKLMEEDSELAEQLNAATYELLSEVGYDKEALAPLVAEKINGQATPPYRYPDLVAVQEG